MRPGVNDDVYIDIVGTPTVTFGSGSASIRSLVSNENLTISGGTFTIAEISQINAGLSLSGGTLSGAGNLTVFGASTWTGSTITGSGGLTTNGPLAITANNQVLIGRTLTIVGRRHAGWQRRPSPPERGGDQQPERIAVRRHQRRGPALQ